MGEGISKTLVVNFFAGPGTGKSTFCAGTFAALKWKDINCEMALEYAKDLVWEGSFEKLKNQLYVFGNQQNRLFSLNGKVDVILTDSPIIQSIVYDTADNQTLKSMILNEHSKYDNLNILLKRKKEYNPKGRVQTFEQAVEIDAKIKSILDSYGYEYEEVDAVPENVQSIVELITNKLKKQ